MANQSPDRREVLEMLAMVAGVGRFPGFSKWISAAGSTPNEPITPRSAVYKPAFFSTAEYRTVDILSELIIPRDETLGAHDAGVSEFIDFIVSHEDPDIQVEFRDGLKWLDRLSRQKYGTDFEKATADQQETMLRGIASSKAAETEGRNFFLLMRRYTVTGYYTSRIGLEQLDDPGLKFYSASPACPHKDDPEHLHLAKAKA